MAFVGDAFRYVTSAMDAAVVTPVASRLANSVANPYVLSYFIWDRIKKLTPQRARDLTRLFSVAFTNGLGVLSADEAKRLGATTRRLQDHVVAASITPEGKNVVLNTVATASKVAQALNTPETKVATTQFFETLQSLIDFFASAPGRNVIATAGECVTGMCEVLASPESAVLLAEVATNICHALEVEALRQEAAKEAAAKTEAEEKDERPMPSEAMVTTFEAEEDKPTGIRSPMSSAEDTAFETESNMSGYSLPSRITTPVMRLYGAVDRLEPREYGLPHQPDASALTTTEIKESSGLRSARIEKDVLLKMGVNPSMLEEVQRVLDRLREEQERDEAASRASAIPEEQEGFLTDEEGSEISSAFGTRMSALPEPMEEEVKTDDEDVVLPEWHPKPVRAALRRRHIAAGEEAAQRHTFEDQSQEMAELLARRQIAHGDLNPEDVIACRFISQILVGAMTVLALLMFYSLCCRILAF